MFALQCILSPKDCRSLNSIYCQEALNFQTYCKLSWTQGSSLDNIICDLPSTSFWLYSLLKYYYHRLTIATSSPYLFSKHRGHHHSVHSVHFAFTSTVFWRHYNTKLPIMHESCQCRPYLACFPCGFYQSD